MVPRPSRSLVKGRAAGPSVGPRVPSSSRSRGSPSPRTRPPRQMPGRPHYASGDGRVPTGVDAWLPDAMPQAPKRVEYRVQVRPTSLSVSVLDHDRDALRLLARFESGNRGTPRSTSVAKTRPSCSRCSSRRVCCSSRAHAAQVRRRAAATALRSRDRGGRHDHREGELRAPRRQTPLLAPAGELVRGLAGWHIDTQEGIARRIDKRVSPAAMRRLMRSPTIGEPMSELTRVIMQGLPRVALEVGAELPDLSQVADVVDLVPTFRMRAGGSLEPPTCRSSRPTATSRSRSAPTASPRRVLFRAPEEGGSAARAAFASTSPPSKTPPRSSRARPRPDESGQAFVAPATTPSASGARARRAARTSGTSSCPTIWSTRRCGTAPWPLRQGHERHGLAQREAVVRGEGTSVSRDELRRCLSEGKRTCASTTARSPPSTPSRSAPCSIARSSCSRRPASRASSRSRRRGACKSSCSRSRARRVAGAKALFQKLSTSTRSRARRSLAPQGDAAPLPGGGALLAQVHPRDRLGRRPRRRHGPRQDGADHRPLLSRQAGRRRRAAHAHRRAHQRGHQLGARARALRADAVASLWHGGARKEQMDSRDAEVVITSYALLRRDEEFLRSSSSRTPSSTRRSTSRTRSRPRRPRPRSSAPRGGSPSRARRSRTASPRSGASSTSSRPGLLGPLDKFESRFAPDRGRATTSSRSGCARTIHPFILRRTKHEVAKDLPEKIEMDQICDLTGEQPRALRAGRCARSARRSWARSSVRASARAQLQILAGLTRLRQAAVRSSPARAAARVLRRRLGQARGAARAGPTPSRAGTRCSSSASS
jgi:hypothetical protein